jgi:hypothetical protein
MEFERMEKEARRRARIEMARKAEEEQACSLAISPRFPSYLPHVPCTARPRRSRLTLTLALALTLALTLT